MRVIDIEPAGAERAHDVAALVAVQPKGKDEYAGLPNTANANHSVFGGQILGQAAFAASRTSVRPLHALIGSFYRPGRMDEPIDYRIDRVRDGGSFTTRHVRAEQRGQLLAQFCASFQDLESGFDYQEQWSEPPPPSGLLSLPEAAAAFGHLPAATRTALHRHSALDVRPLDPAALFDASDHRPIRLWMRARASLGARRDLWLPTLAYISDYLAASGGIVHHSRFVLNPKLFGVTLSHSLWIHRITDPSQWLYHEIVCNWTGTGRSLNNGRLYTSDGTQVATWVQEAVLRQRITPPVGVSNRPA